MFEINATARSPFANVAADSLAAGMIEITPACNPGLC